MIPVGKGADALWSGETCSVARRGSSRLPKCGRAHISSGCSDEVVTTSITCDISRPSSPSLPRCSSDCRPSHLQTGGSACSFRYSTSCTLADSVPVDTYHDREGRSYHRNAHCAGHAAPFSVSMSDNTTSLSLTNQI